MPGYLISMGDLSSIEKCIEQGVYSTIINPIKNNPSSLEGTFADFCSMNQGDNIYFFHKRKIYGIGILSHINNSCSFLNYPTSNTLENHEYIKIKKDLLVDYGEVNGANHRFLCVFIPAPLFFKNGIDMDEVLASSQNQFNSIRVFQGLSFIKLSEDENIALKSIILRKNANVLLNNEIKYTFKSDHNITHKYIRSKLGSSKKYNISIKPLLKNIYDQNGKLKHEMALEACLMYQLTKNEKTTTSIFGKWDYLAHQVAASPFKPIHYMDKMDIFGYKYLGDEYRVINQFLIIELKKDLVVREDIFQLMKYVDWVKNQYCGGDYSMIEAFIVGYEFDKETEKNYKNDSKRNYISGFRPSIPKEWDNLKLVKYSYSGKNVIDFKIV